LDRALAATSHAGKGYLSHCLGLVRPVLPSGVILSAF